VVRLRLHPRQPLASNASDRLNEADFNEPQEAKMKFAVFLGAITFANVIGTALIVAWNGLQALGL